MESCVLISLDHVHQIIPALTAFKYWQHKNPCAKRFIFLKPHIKRSAEEHHCLTALLTSIAPFQLLNTQPWQQQWKYLAYLPVRLRLFFLAYAYKDHSITHIFYAHDISSDFCNQTLFHLFPKAERICYGDSLGLVYSYSYFQHLMFQQQGRRFSARHLIGSFKRFLVYPRPSKRLQAHHAILGIPCDPGGDFLTQCQLHIPPVSLMRLVTQDLSHSLPAFVHYQQTILAMVKFPVFIFITSNLYESKLTSLKNEIALYQDILKTHVPPEATIILKPHPASSEKGIDSLMASLSLSYQVHVIPKQFLTIPIELAQIFIQKTRLLSISYSSISIPFLYERAVQHVLTEELIQHYFLPERQQWMLESNALFLSLMSKNKRTSAIHD